MVGLQGSGKTTTTAKIARRLTEVQKRKVLMASLDIRRPAAMEQLAVLGQQVGVETLPIVAGQTPVQIAERALQAARLGGYDVVHARHRRPHHARRRDDGEAAEVRRAANPHEVLLVADALTGQDAVNLARAFNERVGLTGIVLTRIDGDGRGGAALSMRAVTGKPIKLIGTGEKLDALEDFHPARIADRILGMGDIVSLVEKAAATIDAEKAARVAEQMRKGAFDLADLREQLTQMQKHGRHARADGHDARHRQDEEPDRRAQSRRKNAQAPGGDHRFDDAGRSGAIPTCSRRAARSASPAGSGTKVEDINKLLKMHRNMADMMKAMGGAKRGPMAGLANMLGFGGGMPSPEADGEARRENAGRPAAPGLPQAAARPAAEHCRACRPNLPGPARRTAGLSVQISGGFPGLGKKK